MRCPDCGSDRTKTYTNTTTNTVVHENIKGYGVCKGVLGWAIFGPVGFLCGLCGMGKGRTRTDVTTHHDTKYICLDCGRKFNR